MERLIDNAAASEMGIDRLELRRRNQLKPEGNPLRGRLRPDLRFRRFPGRVRARARCSPTGRALPSASARAAARQAARHRGRQLSRSDGAAQQGDGRHPLRARRHRDLHHRHARLRPGPRHAVRANPVEPARRAVRPHPPPAGRQRRVDRRRRHRRLALGRGEQHRHGRGGRQGGRAGQADRLARARSGGRRHRIRQWALRHRGHRPRDRRAGARRQAARRRSSCRRTRRRSLDVKLASEPVPSAFPEWLPCRRGRDRSRDRRRRGGEIRLRQRLRHRSSIRCWWKARCMAGSSRASARC